MRWKTILVLGALSSLCASSGCNLLIGLDGGEPLGGTGSGATGSGGGSTASTGGTGGTGGSCMPEPGNGGAAPMCDRSWAHWNPSSSKTYVDNKDGTVTDTPLTITQLNSSQYEVRYKALRGFYYDLQSTLSLSQSFTNDPPGTSQPFNALSVARTNSFSEPMKLYRAVTRLSP